MTHELFRGRKDPFNLRLESYFHVLTRLNIYHNSQVEHGSSAEYTLLFSAASTKERKMLRNPGVRCGVILCVSVHHAAREEVLKVEVRLFFLERAAEARRLTMLSLGPTFDITSSETPLIID